ncbi:MAG: putative ABC transport system ATP-binding protein [Chloroflexi bacterium]|nr:MAG: putative ABC transport system ATP-binding protein [Chloroflexota bacterium]
MTADRPLAAPVPPADVLHTIVDAQNVSRQFRVGSEDVLAVRDVSLHVGRGEFVALMGRSGSGKTTLLNLLAGLDHPDSGTVKLAGHDITTASEPQLLEIRRHTIGFVFQSFGLLPLLSAYENVEVALRIAGMGLKERRERATELLHLVDLHARSDHRPYELSGGEQQRVAIARALANRPALIVADEPTGELDHTNARAIFQLLQDLVRDSGVTILAATHDRTVLEYADRVEEMADGRLLGHHERDITAGVDTPGEGLIDPSGATPLNSETVNAPPLHEDGPEPRPQPDSTAAGAGTAEPAPVAPPAAQEAPPASLPVEPDFRPPPAQRQPWAKD